MNHKPDLLLDVCNVVRKFPQPRSALFRRPAENTVVDDVSLQLVAGKNLGIVGESGSGKTTLARIIMGLDSPTSGTVAILGKSLHELTPVELRQARRHFQMVFQDPFGSLDPRMDIARIVTEPLAALTDLTAADRRDCAREMLIAVGMRDNDLNRHPHEFSGGQRQRIAIARALITRPRLIVADEPVSALDVSIQAQVLNLMMDIQDAYGVTYLLISHDLTVVHHLCPDVAVMYQGKIVERGATERIFSRPEHPYTQALVSAVPSPMALGFSMD